MAAAITRHDLPQYISYSRLRPSLTLSQGGQKEKEWTSDDDAKLKELNAEGKEMRAIAKEMKRSQDQCRKRLEELGNGGGSGSKKKDDGGKKNGNGNGGGGGGGADYEHMTKKEKKAARKAAAEADDHKHTTDTKKKASSHAGSKSGEARFTMGEWVTLQEDDLFSFGELQCLSELVMRDQNQTWLRVAASFYDKTGRRVHPEDIREKFEQMGAMR